MNNTPFSTNLYDNNHNHNGNHNGNDVRSVNPCRRSSISYFAEEDEKADFSTFDDGIFRPENVFSNSNFTATTNCSTTTTVLTKLEDEKVDISTFDDAIAYPNNNNDHHQNENKNKNQKPPPPPPPPPPRISRSSSIAVVTPDPPMMSRKRKKEDNNDDRYNTRLPSLPSSSTSSSTSSSPRFRSHQAEGWMSKYEELLDYRLQFGHCLVPNQYSDNPSLAEWVKRQRYQYKLKGMGKHTSMSNDRIIALEKLGFVWNSHDAVWEERLKELKEFKHVNHGDTNVPSLYPPNPQLAVWVKRQRRQYKFLCEGKSTTITKIRVNMLREIDFSWSGRRNKSEQRGGEQLCETESDDFSEEEEEEEEEEQNNSKKSGLTLTTKRTMA